MIELRKGALNKFKSFLLVLKIFIKLKLILNMKYSISLILLFALSAHHCFAQETSIEDFLVISPLVEISEMDTKKVFMKKYDPFDDITLFASYVGIQIYNDDMKANMYPLVASPGKLDKYKPELGMALLFIVFDNEMNRVPIGGDEIIFLIDDERKVMKFEDPTGIITFEWSEFANLINSENVRARISGENYSIELNWDSKVKQLIIPFINGLVSANDE